jgi:transposase InsO family protein
MISTLPVSDDKLREIKEETSKDGTMQTLVKIISEGWPSHKDHLPSSLYSLWNYREEITVIEGVVFKGNKIFIPPLLRDDVLKKIHQSHMGVGRSKQQARELVFWPGINKDIESVVKNCTVCAEYRSSNQKEPMVLNEVPKYPWQIVATDMFFWNGDDYLLVVDYYSRFWEIFKVSSTKSAVIIDKMKTLFARHGIPEVIKSDNGPQYPCGQFAEFAKTWGFKNVTSSPLYPKSNGLAERTVRTVKLILSKARKDHQDPYLAILEHRNTPINDVGSPAQLSMGRRLRSKMPSSTEQLQPKMVNPTIVQKRLKQKQAEQKKYYDRSSKPLEHLSAGDDVFVQREGKWKPAIVTRYPKEFQHYDRRWCTIPKKQSTFEENV